MILTEPIQSRCCFPMFRARMMDPFLGQETRHRPKGGQDMSAIGIADRATVLVIGSIPNTVFPFLPRMA